MSNFSALMAQFSLSKLSVNSITALKRLFTTKSVECIACAKDEQSPIVSPREAMRFMKDCLVAAGATCKNAKLMAEPLICADCIGHFSHGMNHLDKYLNDLTEGLCDGKATPTILKETDATAWVDGCNGLGGVVANFCMELAIKKASAGGIGWVSCKGSNHFGIISMYPLRCLRHNLIGFACSNTSPFVTPVESEIKVLGTNPISIVAPGEDHDSFVFEAATTMTSAEKLEKEKEDISRYNAAAEKENPYKPKTLGLSVMVEIFCGILAGSKYGPHIPMSGKEKTVADLGHTFVALNPECFAPNFQHRLSDILNTIRNLKDPKETPVLVAGDLEKLAMNAVKCAGGIRYPPELLCKCDELAKKYCVQPLALGCKDPKDAKELCKCE